MAEGGVVLTIDENELRDIVTGEIPSWKTQLPTAFQKKMQKVVVMLMTYVKQSKLTGQVLKVQTGTLRRSITGKVISEGTNTYGKVGTNVKYGVFWERGGTIPAHTIEPKRAKALHFFVQGKEVFCKSVYKPARQVEARPFLKPALEEKREQIVRMIGDVPMEVMMGEGQ